MRIGQSEPVSLDRTTGRSQRAPLSPITVSTMGVLRSVRSSSVFRGDLRPGLSDSATAGRERLPAPAVYA